MKDQEPDPEAELSDSNGWGYAICTTIPSQVEPIKWVKFFGFKKLSTFKNPYHKSNYKVTLWGLNLNEFDPSSFS